MALEQHNRFIAKIKKEVVKCFISFVVIVQKQNNNIRKKQKNNFDIKPFFIDKKAIFQN